jgi:hypothetical protein
MMDTTIKDCSTVLITRTLRNFSPEIFFEDVHCHLVRSAVSSSDGPKPNQVKI